MASPELRRLWKLHQIDEGLLELRKRAANLDPGRKIQSEIKALEEQYADVGGKAKALSTEQTDLELKQKGIDEKLKKIDKDLYGGSVVSPREVENFEKEIASLKKQRGQYDERLLELWEEAPPAKEAAEKIEKQIAAKKQELAEHQKKVLQVKAQIEQDFKKLSAARPEAVKDIPAALLNRYELVRKQHAGIGMAQIVLKTKMCGACGTHLPERTVESAKEDRLVTCEACHRILYYTEGVV